MCYLAGIKERIGFNTEHRGFLLTKKVEYDSYKHESLCFLDVLKADGLKTKDTFSISFRSNKYVNVCDIARVFNGGGHIRAAGAEVMLPYKELLQQIIEVSKKAL